MRRIMGTQDRIYSNDPIANTNNATLENLIECRECIKRKTTSIHLLTIGSVSADTSNHLIRIGSDLNIHTLDVNFID